MSKNSHKASGMFMHSEYLALLGPKGVVLVFGTIGFSCKYIGATIGPYLRKKKSPIAIEGLESSFKVLTTSAWNNFLSIEDIAS